LRQHSEAMKLSLALVALVAAQSSDAQDGYDTPVTQEDFQTSQYEQASPAQYKQAEDKCVEVCPIQAPCFHEESGMCAVKESYKQYGQITSECPPGYTDSSYNLPTQTWPFWVGFALLFTPGLWFLCITIGDIFDDSSLNSTNATTFTREHMFQRLMAGFICLVASLAYFAMATNNGLNYRCCDGRVFYYARYVDWIITTPVMLYEIVSIANGARKEENKVQDFEIFYIIILDILMIVAGLIGSLVCSRTKWVFFAFSVLSFIPILKTLCQLSFKDPNVVLSDHQNVIARLYKRISYLTVLAWSLYPLVWILSTGTNILSATGETIFYTALDVVAKSVFGYIITTQLKPSNIKFLKANGM